MRKPLASIACFCLLGAAQDTSPQFEVVSVKPNPSVTENSNLNHQLPDRFTATNVPLGFLLLDAYELKAHQLIGAPGWVWDKSYDIIATFPAADRPQLHTVHLMEQHLLAERFGLQLHPEQRILPAYDLVPAKNDGRLGPQLHPSSIDCVDWAAHGRPAVEGVPRSPVSPTGERPICNLFTTRTWLSGGARTMQDLASSLQAMLGRPVVNKTGLPGPYDIDLQWARTDLQADPTAPSDSPSLSRAVEEQLGLKLVPHKEPFAVLVVDHIQPPTPN